MPNLQIQDFLSIFETEETILEILPGKRNINSQESKKLAQFKLG
jgi:HTH-type transcriptional regulator/antitoxin HigA